jgi:DeoR/GlpR family transcriptional regulator of sugar metabolism
MKSLRGLQIYDYLKIRKLCSMNELMEQFGISPATLYRDVKELTGQNLVRKVHGGVALIEEDKGVESFPDSHFSLRINKNLDKKEIIAELALQFVEEGDIVFLDSSTTALQLARRMQRLSFSHLTLITNSVLIIQEFHLFPPCFSLISLGGLYHPQLHSFLGKSAIASIRSMRPNKFFFSAYGLTPAAVTTYHENHADFLSETLSLSSTRILLLDSTKFNREGLFRICEVDKIDCLVTDTAPPEPLAQALRRVASDVEVFLKES